MAKKTIRRVKYPLEDNVKRMLFLRGGGGEGDVTNITNQGTLEIPYATRIEVDAGTITDKVVSPDTGGYAYDRLRKVGRHEAGKGTKIVALTPDTGVVTINCQRSNVFYVNLTDAETTFANPVSPINAQTVNIFVVQPESGDCTGVFGDQWAFTNRIDPQFTQEPNAVDLLSCQWNPVLGKFCCSFLPDFGSGYTPPPPLDEGSLNFINLGGGNEVALGRDLYFPDEVNFRTIVGGGDVSVTTVDDTIVVSYSTPSSATVEVLNDLLDVDTTTDFPAVGDTLTFDGENWIPARPRTWSLGATWTNGNNVLATPVNEVNSIVSEPAVIRGWYLLTSGGSGSCEVDVRRSTFGSFPPDAGDSLCSGVEPSISSGTANNDTDLTGWTTALNEGDILQFVLSSTSTFKTVQIILILERDVG